jgi:23S rRNA pseudouridine2605 synthase
MLERLQKILAKAGIASRREAENIISSGRVAVNGVTVSEMGVKADPEKDRITVDGVEIRLETTKVYIMLYKPVGYMTTLKDPEGRPIVTDLLPDIKERVYPVGRLDYNTEGLLLLTNDGEWANSLAHPRHEVDKEYQVRIQGQISNEQMRKLAEGVELDDGMTAPAYVKRLRESDKNAWFTITIHEGRYRQVRRMCEAVNLNVVRLKRSRYGFLKLGDLQPGEYRLLSSAEVERLRSFKKGGPGK